MDPEVGREGTTQCDLRTALPPTLNTTPPEGTGSLAERQWLPRTPTWRSHQNWGQRSPAFSEEEAEKAPSPKPPVKELCKWVTWKAEACKMPSWCRELMAVPKVEDHEKLAWEVQASFQLLKRVSKLHKMENYHQAPPALPCLLRKNFLPPPNSIFSCHYI